VAVREKYAHLPELPCDIGRRLKRLPALMERHPIRLAYLFGSACEHPEVSHDIDLAILPDKGYSFTALYADLSLHLGTDRIDLVELPLAPFWLQREIVRTGRLIYCRDPMLASRYEAGILSLCHEMQHHQRAQIRTLLRRQCMGIDSDFLWRVVLQLYRTAEELERYRGTTSDDLATSLSLRWTVEHGLQTGLTLILQAASHLLTRHFGVAVDSYEASLTELRAHRVISPSLYKQLRGAGGFRNVLVHEYLQIDLSRVVRFLKKAPVVFRAFAEELTEWLEQQESRSDATE